MKKELKDYLHFHLRCECIFDNEKWFIEGIRTLTATHPDSQDVYLTKKFESYSDRAFVNNSKIKPILRPLSDMTKKELNFLNEGHGIESGITVYYTPEGIKYLLSKHFDLFGLIEAGLAIDSTTLNKKP